MRFRMLGPLQVKDGRTWSAVRAMQQRQVLAVLLIEAGQVVATERLVYEIWGERPPRAAVKVVQGYVAALRRSLGGAAGPLLTRGQGYQLQVEDDDLDARLFDRLVVSAGRAAAGGQPDVAVDLLGEALELWQGPALADVPASLTVTAEATRLDQARLSTLELRLDAMLEVGRHAEVAGEARRLVEEHPARERLRAHLMLSLYRCGRRADALHAYRSARRDLVQEYGLEPGPQLQQLHQRILADHPDLAGPNPAPAGRVTPGPVTPGLTAAAHVVPAQLPAEVAAFTGRGAELARLNALLPVDDSVTPAPVISTITGTAGVGKTALAVRWAHQVAGRFPDGQLYVNLRGYAAGTPLRPIDALAGFLPALGLPAAEVPHEVDQAAALYRSLLAGKRMLVLLDNANHPDQVRPLLPASPGCLVLVTSRSRLAGLAARDGAVRLGLDVLTPAEAETLMASLLGPERVDAEPDATAELARLCGHLPLALRIAAANLATSRHTTIADHAARLSGGDRLTALAVDGDPQAAVRTAFDHSYTALPDQTQRLFRRLGLVPGPDITAPAAAALAGLEHIDAASRLVQLADAHLIEHRGPGRYAAHDLIRLYAADQATTEDSAADRRAAMSRLLAFYLHSVDSAAAHVYPQILRLPLPPSGAGQPRAGFSDHVQALRWLDAERPNLVAAITHAAAHGHHAAAWQLADALRGYLYLGRHTVDWRAVADAGLAAAEADDEPRPRAAARISIGMLHWTQSRYQQAIDEGNQALAMTRHCGWTEGESAALGNLGNVHAELGQLSQAADYMAQALAIDRHIGRTAGQAIKLANLGAVYWFMGQLRLAVDHHTQALAIHPTVGDRFGQGKTLINLGGAYHALGQFDDALAALTHALAIHQELDDRCSQANTLHLLAAVHRDLGHHGQAAELAAAAVTLARDGGSQIIESGALTVQASVHHHQGDVPKAIRGHHNALQAARANAHRYTEAQASIGLATSYLHEGNLDQAVQHAESALAIARLAGYRMLEGVALTVLANIRLHQDQPKQALDDAEEASAIHAETGHRLGAANTHLTLAQALARIGNADEAAAHHHRAEAQFAAIGALWPPTTAVR